MKKSGRAGEEESGRRGEREKRRVGEEQGQPDAVLSGCLNHGFSGCRDDADASRCALVAKKPFVPPMFVKSKVKSQESAGKDAAMTDL